MKTYQVIQARQLELRLAKQELNRTLAQIEQTEREHMGELKTARKTGKLDSINYAYAILQISSSSSPFQTMRTEAMDKYGESVQSINASISC